MKSEQEVEEKETGSQMADPSFRLRRIVILGCLALALLALFSYDPEDLDYFAGGISGIGYPHNWLGAIGTYCAWNLLASFGLAAFILIAVALICSIRRLVWRQCLCRSGWKYFFSILGVGIGCSMLFGLYPSSASGMADAMNIHNFPGGVLGNFFCSSEYGFFYRLLSPIGTSIVAAVILAISLGVIWMCDWNNLFMNAIRQGNSGNTDREDEDEDEPLDEATPLSESSSKMRGENTFFPIGGKERLREKITRQELKTENEEEDRPRFRRQNVISGNGPAKPAFPKKTEFQAPVQEENPEAGEEEKEFASPFVTMPRPQRDNVPSEVVQVQAPRRRPAARDNQLSLPMEIPPQPVKMVEPVVSTTPAVFQGDPDQLADYALPSIGYLNPPPENDDEEDDGTEYEDRKQKIQDTLDQCGLDAEVVDYVVGPQVTLFKIETAPGMKIEKLGGYQSNFTMAVRSMFPVRMVLPILGTGLVGIEVPNNKRRAVPAGELFSSASWLKSRMEMPIMLGKDINGDSVTVDLTKAPHMLIAGATGSGKSVCMFMLLTSLLFKFSPDDLKLIIVDPKLVDYEPFRQLPHLLCPLIQEPEKVGIPLKWAITEMNRRYDIIRRVGARNIQDYNNRKHTDEMILDDEGEPLPDRLPYIVILIDELSDLMCSNRKKEIETAIQILGQKSRAAGIHMVIATQRPDVKVITGNIKANIPYRIAFTTLSQIDSRTILDSKGAEELTGMGDMLLKDNSSMRRIQGGWIDSGEVKRIADSCSAQVPQSFNAAIMDALKATEAVDEDDDMDNTEDWEGDEGTGTGRSNGGERLSGLSKDEQLLHDAMEQIIKYKKPSISFVQRVLQVGYNKAANIIDSLEKRGYISPELPGTRGNREILIWHCPGDDGVSSDYGYDEDDEENSGSNVVQLPDEDGDSVTMDYSDGDETYQDER